MRLPVIPGVRARVVEWKQAGIYGPSLSLTHAGEVAETFASIAH